MLELDFDMFDDTLSFRLPYGRSGVFAGEMLRKRVAVFHRPRKKLPDLDFSLAAALESPLEFPAFKQTFVPGDKVAIVADPATPQLAEILRRLCQALETAQVEPADITLVCSSAPTHDPLAELTEQFAGQVKLVVHEPAAEDGCAYLANTAGGERVYLSKEVVFCDSVILVGEIGFDDVLGYRGTASSLFPGLSDAASQARFRGQGHEELALDDIRPMRQMVDEIGWLLGCQFAVGIIPGPGTAATDLLAGHADAVLRTGSKRLQEEWKIDRDERVELVLLAVNEDASGHGWHQVCKAIDVGRRLVQRDGRIVVLSQLKEPPGQAFRTLAEAHAPREALAALKQPQTEAAVDAQRLARALDWANVYLLSDLPTAQVEELFLMPLTGAEEVTRFLDGDDLTAIICGAQHAYVRCEG